jgi:hypothetical protein
VLTITLYFMKDKYFCINAPLHISDGGTSIFCGTDDVRTQLASTTVTTCRQTYTHCRHNSVTDNQEAGRGKEL